MENRGTRWNLQRTTARQSASLKSLATREKNEVDESGQKRLKSKQAEILNKVVERILDENRELQQSTKTKPLVWCIHGGPGVGKSFVIKQIRQCFEQVCGWQQGLDFQIMALQAVMADQLNGETIHGALGLDPFRNHAKTSKTSKKAMETSKCVSQWRWLIIDEISMLSASFLAEIDMRLRDVMADAQAYKTDMQGRTRPFGGINVLLVGDFWQLDPPQGISLAKFPEDYIRSACKYHAAATTAHGQALL